jgi:hypothetical protein
MASSQSQEMATTLGHDATRPSVFPHTDIWKICVGLYDVGIPGRIKKPRQCRFQNGHMDKSTRFQSEIRTAPA